MKTHTLGELDELVLLATSILYHEAYAFAIKQLIYEQAHRTVALPTVHAALYRLEKRGFLRSELGGATTERGGRRKRLFTITNTGMQALRDVQTARERMWSLLQEMRPSGGLS